MDNFKTTRDKTQFLDLAWDLSEQKEFKKGLNRTLRKFSKEKKPMVWADILILANEVLNEKEADLDVIDDWLW